MKYTRPLMKRMTIDIKLNSSASDYTSCAGGHCVRARYENDH